MIDPVVVPEHRINDLAFEIVGRVEGNRFIGEVYLGTEIVWSCNFYQSDYPAGLEDFTNHTGVRFARKLRDALFD